MKILEFIKKIITVNEVKQKENNVVSSPFGKLSIYDSNSIEKRNEQKAIFLEKTSRRANKLFNKDEEYPSTLRFWYDIKNIRQLHSQLINEGYYRQATISEILNTNTISELKEFANTHGITVKGNKKDLVNQIVENLNDEEINNIVNQAKLYFISDKGIEYIEKYKDFLILAENYSWDINVKQYNDLKKKYSNINDIYEIAALDLEEKILKYNKNKDYSHACVSIIALEKIYLDKENIEMAMEKYLTQILYDINFATYQNFGYDLSKDSILSSVEFYIKNKSGCIAPANIKNINKYGNYINDNMITKIFNEYRNSFYYLINLDIFKDLVYSIVNNEFEEDKYLKIIYKNIK